MKRIFLILLAFPYLANAQVYETIDSVYTYEGENRTPVRIAAYTYGGNNGNWNEMTQERGMLDINEDGVISDDEEYMIDYTYTNKGDWSEEKVLYEEEGLWYYKTPDGWSAQFKFVLCYTFPYKTLMRNYQFSDKEVIHNYQLFNYEEDDWLLAMKRLTVEYNDRNLPSVQIDSMYYTDGTAIAQRIELLYNEDGRCSVSTIYEETDLLALEHDWNASFKTEFFYNREGKVEKEIDYHYSGDEWSYSSTTEYKYNDGHGDCISEIRSNKNGIVSEIYYEYKYSIRGANEHISSVQTKAYPNPVSDVLHVSINGADNATITITNIAGSIVVQQKTNQPITQIPVHSLSGGYYFLTVQTATKTETHKVFIKR